LLFGDRLLAHLAACGVKLEELTVQTDNGSEFGGAWNRRRTHNGRPQPARNRPVVKQRSQRQVRPAGVIRQYRHDLGLPKAAVLTR